AMDLHDLEQLWHRHPHLLGQFLRPRVAIELPLHLVSCLKNLVAQLNAVHRSAYGSAGVDETPRDSLANPPSRVGGKPKSETVIEFLHRPHQSQVSLLNQIQETQTTIEV